MRGNAARALVPALGVLALVGVVAVAATGSTGRGSAGTRRPSDLVLDTFFSFALLAMLPAAALLVYGLMQRREIAQEIASGKYRRSGPAAFIAFALLFGLFWYFGPRRLGSPFTRDEETVEIDLLRPRPQRPESGETYHPEFAWIPVLVVLGLAAIGIGAYVVAARRRARALDSAESRLAEQVADVVDESLDDLRTEPDARRAVIAAYARLERALAASGLPRLRHETAGEYVARILGKLEVDKRAVKRLTDLFTWAKFSQHEVDTGMKDEAIDALVHVRDELREADARHKTERTEGLLAAERRA